MAVNENPDFEGRLAAVEAWTSTQKKVMTIGDLGWDAVESDIRSLAVNYILRRQLEALDATVLLAKGGLGHLSVGFVRPALDELLWMLWVKDLSQQDAQDLLNTMGIWDGIRSLLAQRAYVGDAVMQELWYPVALLDAQDQHKAAVRDKLKTLGQQYHWAGGVLPSASWVAEQSGHEALYEYLHAASSRALHFSVGEITRHSWGEPGGAVTTLNPNFREYRTTFALFQLPLLFAETFTACVDLLDAAGIVYSADEVLEERILAEAKSLGRFGQVPLVHAHEWNLRPPAKPTEGSGRAG
ncbi:DUF5677 domain-containing protein [Nocardia sp. NPDC059246]|uniref:DUF5677 domain-containing protein n=1 Tax=unclassified Nocardia TaxID=2637762 RepID=UPI00369F565E